MKLAKIGKLRAATAVAAAGIAVAAQMSVGTNSASATVDYTLRNAATGKCLTAVMVAPLPTALRMQTCGSTSTGQTQKFTGAGNYIEVAGTGTGFLVCLVVQTNASSSFASTPMIGACKGTGYKTLTYSGIGSGKLILAGCYLGHYSSSDTYASCYNNNGNYTKWNWVRA
jgi:hypothetical protein